MCGDGGADDWSSRQVARTDHKSSAQQPRGVGPILSTSINTHFERKEEKKQKTFLKKFWLPSVRFVTRSSTSSLHRHMDDSVHAFLFCSFPSSSFSSSSSSSYPSSHLIGLPGQIRVPTNSNNLDHGKPVGGGGGWNTTVRTSSLWACLKLDLWSRLDVMKED